jgi:hypothetical protein
MEWVKGWKVVRKLNNGRFVSATYGYGSIFIEDDIKRGWCFYKKDKITKRPKGCGPLGCFKTIKDARYFAGNMWTRNDDYNFYVFPCFYMKSKDTYFWLIDNYGDVIENPYTFYPKGGIFADKIKLI